MDFWDVHGIFFLLGCAFFPRITTLFFATITWGLWSILGWIFAPHLLVAIYATTAYWDTNPILVIIAWFFAFGGTAGEGRVAVGASRR